MDAFYADRGYVVDGNNRDNTFLVEGRSRAHAVLAIHYRRGIHMPIKEGQLGSRRKMVEQTEAWSRVRHYRERLKDCQNYPVLDGLESSWEVLDSVYDGVVKRADDERVSSTPLSAFFYYVDMGFYPPPEILLALNESYRNYMNAGGNLSLEDVFFGRPKRKAGNYARREASSFRKIWLAFRLDELQRKGNTSMQAAEILSEQLGGHPEPESILKIARHPVRRRSQKN